MTATQSSPEDTPRFTERADGKESVYLRPDQGARGSQGGLLARLGRALQRGTKRAVMWARLKSPWVLHFNSGGCNGCDIEILDLLTPRYDVERLGILKEASPRHADVLLCTGPVTRQSRDRLLRIYEQIPAPKWVIAVGSCSCSGGVFQGGLNVLGGVDQLLPVDVYVPGCPCRPEAVIDGVVHLLASLKG